MKQHLILEEGEEIRPIKGFPHYYVSNLGNTYSDYPSKLKGSVFRVLRYRNHPTGYKYIGLYRLDEDDKIRRYWKRVHRVVWEAFGGELKRNMVVDHIDENKGNNRLENLQMLSQSHNKIKAIQFKKIKQNENMHN
jgi:hypothetical protein